jgi:hypothetical protein
MYYGKQCAEKSEPEPQNNRHIIQVFFKVVVSTPDELKHRQDDEHRIKMCIALLE